MIKKLAIAPLSLMLSTLLYSHASFAADTQSFGQTVNMKFCIFDIAGTKGDAFTYAKDLVLEAKKWKLDIDLKVYTDERIAAEDFKAGQCEGVAISTMRAKQFNFFIGSVDSPVLYPLLVMFVN